MAGRNAWGVQARRLNELLIRLAGVWLVTVALAAAQVAPNAKSKVSDQPLTAEQLAIYRKTLTTHFPDEGKIGIHLASKTVPYALDDKTGDCAKKIGMAKIDSAEVHLFRKRDLPQLGLKRVEIVDLSAVVRGVVPLVVSEIRFDDKHESAMVWIGSAFDLSHPWGGMTVLLRMEDGVWQERIVCSTWERF